MAGNTITIEPAIYIPDTTSYASHFRGIGIRIEDSVVVTRQSPPRVVSEAALKS